MKCPRSGLAALVLCSSLATQIAHADELVVLVAGRDTPAAAAAEKLANGTTTFYEPKLFKGLTKAASLLGSGSHRVIVKVAQGQETGQGGSGNWVVPPIANLTAKLHVLGGYGADFVARDPFGHPTELLTVEGRGGPILALSPKSQLGELVISGFVFDAAPSNKYDAKTNSILKGSSRSYPLLAFQQVVTQHLVVADNVFLNGAHGAFDPYVSPASNDATVDIQNNFFINTIKVMKLSPAGYKGFKVKELNIRGNSFLANWPFNPDPTSSNVAAIELYHKDCCAQLNVEKNIFAFNVGGAMQHDWKEDRMPPMNVSKNLFFSNAALFGDDRPEAGFIVGKFGLNPKYLILTPNQAADDYSYAIKDNVVLDPQIPIALVVLGSADSSSVQAQKTPLNDLRGLIGLNKDGGTVAIKNFAPRVGIDVANLPFPKEPKAAGFGVSRADVFKP